MGRDRYRGPQIIKPPLRAARGLGGTLGCHSGRIRRSLRPKSCVRTALGLGRPVVPVDWRLEVLASQNTCILSSAQPGARARELTGSILSMSSPPWLPTQPKRQTTGTTRWIGYVRWPGACFCGSLGGLDDLNGPREPTRASRRRKRRFRYLRSSEAVKPH